MLCDRHNLMQHQTGQLEHKSTRVGNKTENSDLKSSSSSYVNSASIWKLEGFRSVLHHRKAFKSISYTSRSLTGYMRWSYQSKKWDVWQEKLKAHEWKLDKPAYKNLVQLYCTTCHTPPCPRSVFFHKEVHYWIAKQPSVEKKQKKMMRYNKNGIRLNCRQSWWAGKILTYPFSVGNRTPEPLVGFPAAIILVVAFSPLDSWEFTFWTSKEEIRCWISDRLFTIDSCSAWHAFCERPNFE